MKSYEKLVMQAISDIQDKPIDLLEIGAGSEEIDYIIMLKDTYIRTIHDVDKYLAPDNKDTNVLEIGSLFGIVSKSLKKLGYRVYALDIPEFQQSSGLRALYEKDNIPFSGVNLRYSKLPYETGIFDAVILCEVLEHFNFNPLPVIKEINRVLKPGGILYIGTPNLASIKNRINLIKGQSNRNPIDDFFQQLDQRFNKIVSLHWREYTLVEIVEMVQKMGFEVGQKYYFSEAVTAETKFLTRLKKSIAYSIPSLRPFLVVIAKKKSECNLEFWSTEANQ